MSLIYEGNLFAKCFPCPNLCLRARQTERPYKASNTVLVKQTESNTYNCRLRRQQH